MINSLPNSVLYIEVPVPQGQIFLFDVTRPNTGVIGVSQCAFNLDRGGETLPEKQPMSKSAAEHHKKAADHHQHASRHHSEAAKHHEAGNHEKAAHHAHAAHGHMSHAQEYGEHASRAHTEEHGSKT
jgi:hypothetical protein